MQFCRARRRGRQHPRNVDFRRGSREL